jgi:large subunit ribosomal protein L10
LSLNRSEKEAVISDVTGLAAKAQTLVMAEYRGITVADMTKLRSSARSNGVSLSVLKNTWLAVLSPVAGLKLRPTR